MKKVLCLLSLCVLISGCANVQTTDANTTYMDHLATAGSLVCKSNELCPNVVVEWDKEQKEKLRLDVALTSTYEYYDIKSLSFSVDGKTFNYAPVGKTEQKYINRLIPKRSSNTFILPSVFLYELRGSKNVDLSIETDKGTIKRNVYSPTVQSSLFKNFTQLISTLPNSNSK